MTRELRSDGKAFTKWLNQLTKNRFEHGGKSVADFRFAVNRARLLSGKNEFNTVGENAADNVPGDSINGVIYWMNRDQRVQDNWALLFAQRIALKFSVPLHVCFNVASSVALRTRRHLNFLLEGLAEVEKDCKDLAISFHLLPPLEAKSKTSLKRNADGSFACNETDHATLQPLVDFLKQRNACAVITDFSPLRDDRQAVEFVSKRLPVGTPFYQVDAHNVVPAWFASDKVEYAARTIRKKLHDKARHLLTEFPPVIRHPVTAKSEPVDWVSVKESLKELVDERVGEVNWAKGGSLAGFSQLYSFLHHRLHAYATGRNDPTKDALSNLSPWLHFGHISAQRCLWEAKRLRTSHPQSVDAFIEEAFVRRELSDNFCLYNPHYDSIQGAWSWARETLKKHAGDARTPTYSSKAMEKAETGDELWNAAQRQLVQEGKLHGFLRMYWAKKILEWHDGGPEEALQLGFRLNDLYSLDGTDPNGYVGVMWSICGVHDQGWVERPIFGKIRYMNFAGCKRKFDVAAFIRRYPPKREPSSCK